MTVRVLTLALVLLFAQSPWAHAARMTDVTDAPGAAHDIPCHGEADQVRPAPADPTTHDCCEGPDCAGFGCHCACSAAPALGVLAPDSPIALWLMRHVTDPPVGNVTLRPPDLFRPPI